jgi:hypothetical protein
MKIKKNQLKMKPNDIAFQWVGDGYVNILSCEADGKTNITKMEPADVLECVRIYIEDSLAKFCKECKK